MMQGFEITSIVLTLCHTQSVPSVTPFCTTHFNQFCTECCLEVTTIPRLSDVSWADEVRVAGGRAGRHV